MLEPPIEPPSTETARYSGSRVRLLLAAGALLVVTVLLLIGASLTRRAPATLKLTKPSNPFSGSATYVNPLKGAERENPFYVNPFAQFEEQKPERGAPIENPFPTPTPTPRP